MSLAMRPRPAALTEQVAAGHVITVKNTFLEVSRASPERRTSSNVCLKTAPASLHTQGALLRSLLSAVDDADWCEGCDKDGTSTPTTADLAPEDTEPSTPSSEPPAGVWPPTPCSPKRQKITISLESGLDTDAFFGAPEHWMAHVPEWADEAAHWVGDWAGEQHGHTAMPLDCSSYEAVPAPPSYPPDFFPQQPASEPAPPLSEPAGSAIFPCVLNAPAPKCAPPLYAPQSVHAGLALSVSSGPEWSASDA